MPTTTHAGSTWGRRARSGAGWIGVLAVVALCGATARARDLTALSAGEAAAAIRTGDITATALVEALLKQAASEDRLNAFIVLDRDGALAAAQQTDLAVARGEQLGALAGVPLVVKDNINAAGLPTTAGTPALAGFVPASSAPVLQRLLDAGAIVLGKTNMHELAFGITSNNAATGPVHNAFDLDRFAGGSSGGTGAAVGAGVAPAGLGTDTGGSVRIPAALNGIAGLRPTVGRYPQAGIVPISHTRDTAGPMARAVADLVLLDGVITGEPADLAAADLGAVRFGVARPFSEGLSPGVEAAFQTALLALEAAGATLVEVDMSAIFELSEKTGFPIALHEVKQDLAAFLADNGLDLTIEDIAEQIASPDVKFVFDNLVLGDQAVPERAYRAAVDEFRPAMQAAYAALFAEGELDAVVFPTTPLEAQPIAGSDQSVMLNGRAVPTFQTFIRNTDPGSNAGVPGLSVPIGFTDQGLPVGIEFDGPSGSDRELLAIGLALEDLMR